MLAALGFLVGEQVEGFVLFDAQSRDRPSTTSRSRDRLGADRRRHLRRRGPRVQIVAGPLHGLQLFLLKPDHIPGDYGAIRSGSRRQGRRLADDMKMRN